MHLLDSTKTPCFSFLFLAHSPIGNRHLFISPVYLCRETTILSEILHTNVQNKAPKSCRFKNAKISILNGKIGHKYTLNCGKKCPFLSPAFTLLTKRDWKNHQKYWSLVSNSCSSSYLNNGGTNRPSLSLSSSPGLLKVRGPLYSKATHKSLPACSKIGGLSKKRQKSPVCLMEIPITMSKMAA